MGIILKEKERKGKEGVGSMPMNEIEELKQKFIEKLTPKKIYLFGSYAEGKQKEDSDFDFYIVVDDEAANVRELTTEAYRSIRSIKQRPVDIIVGTSQRFEERKTVPSIEYEVARKGILLYGV